ncbi:MAG TPA: hypothetical protein VMD05_08185 [Candidatus Nanoarchaeia archaeon]|nr:hypothetical protein [Candidatus Nanoarchaeia archaeon]
MKKFLILYMAPVSAEVQMNVSPEEVKKGMEPWNAWFKKCGKEIVDMGAPLGKGMHFSKRGSSKGKTEITGYTIVQAEDMDGVKAMVAGHPHFMLPKATIEVLEIMPMGM